MSITLENLNQVFGDVMADLIRQDIEASHGLMELFTDAGTNGNYMGINRRSYEGFWYDPDLWIDVGL